MILGIGIDLMEIARIRKEMERPGGSFLDEILTDSEQKYCLTHKDPAPSVAARFAAKEAMFKALGTGKRGRMRWRDVEVQRDDLGKPSIRLEGEVRSTADRQGVDRIHLTLTHTAETAAAAVLLETI